MALCKKKILVTGASRGIGRATAERLAAQGADLALMARTRSDLEGLSNQLKKNFPDCKVFFEAFDIADTEATTQFVSRASEALQGLDGLVNNAAILMTQTLEQSSIADVRKIFDVNVFGLFGMTQAFVKQKHRGLRSVVNISSVGGMQGAAKFPGLSSYCATKFAVVGLTEVWAEELREKGVRVNAVAPGGTETEMLRAAFPGFEARLKPSDIANAICYFLDDELSSAVTGTWITIPS